MHFQDEALKSDLDNGHNNGNYNGNNHGNNTNFDDYSMRPSQREGCFNFRNILPSFRGNRNTNRNASINGSANAYNNTGNNTSGDNDTWTIVNDLSAIPSAHLQPTSPMTSIISSTTGVAVYSPNHNYIQTSTNTVAYVLPTAIISARYPQYPSPSDTSTSTSTTSQIKNTFRSIFGMSSSRDVHDPVLVPLIGDSSHSISPSTQPARRSNKN